MVQLSHPYMTTGKTIALTRWTFVGKVMSLLFNMLSMLVIASRYCGLNPVSLQIQSHPPIWELWELDLCCLSCTVYGIFIIEAWIDQDTWQIPEGGLGAEEDSGGESSRGNWVFEDKTEEVASSCLCCSRKPGKTSLPDHRLLHWTRASRVEPYTGLERRKFLRIPHLLGSPRMGRHWTLLQTSL